MKLLIFCHEFPPVGGGASNALYHLGVEWVSLGHEVAVVTSHHGDLPEEETVRGMAVYRLKVGRRRLFRGHTHEMLGFMWKSVRLSDRLYKNFKPDLSVAFMTLPAGAACLYLYFKYKLPYVTELRGADVPGFNPKSLGLHHFLTGPFVKAIWKRSKKLIANSEGLYQIARKFCPNQDVLVLPNGVDTDKFHPGLYAHDNRDRIKLLFVGRFEETQKNIAMLIESLAAIPNIELTLVGDGKEKLFLMKEVRKHFLEARIHFTGWLKEKDLIEAYQEADIFVSASKWEGMPNVVLEAMSTGLPVLLSAIPGHQELVREGENGYLFRCEDMATLEKHLRALASDANLRASMGKKSREIVLEKHDWHKLAKAHLAAFGAS